MPSVENFDLYKTVMSDSMWHLLETYLNYSVNKYLEGMFPLYNLGSSAVLLLGTEEIKAENSRIKGKRSPMPH
jgi:hypothetical protein